MTCLLLHSFLRRACGPSHKSIQALVPHTRHYSNIPEIDFQYFHHSPAAQKDIADKLKNACSSIGFMYVKNVDGLTQELIDKCLDHTATFFNLPQSSKNSIHTSEGNMKGYYKFTGSGGNTADKIEAFLMGNDISTVDDLRRDYFKSNVPENWKNLLANQPNQWILGEEYFRTTMLEYWQGCCVASTTILQALALSLGLQKDYLTEKHAKKDCSMELKRYPPLQRQQFHTRLPPHLKGLQILKKETEEADDTQHRFNEHSDLSSITLLVQTPDIDCLEVKNTSGEWIKARAYPGSILVNTGDVMERWTNGMYPSTRHRVVTNRDQKTDRYSAVFFCMPDWETPMTPLNSQSPTSTTHLFGDLLPFN